MIERELLEEEAERRVENAGRILSQFQKEFAEKPGYTLEWSAPTAFEKAAELQVWKTILEKRGTYRTDVTSQEVVEHFSKRALSAILNRATWPVRSASPTATLWEECVSQAWASVYKTINEEF
jgi:hypothetical protein